MAYYITLADAELYFADRWDSGSWNTASDNEKVLALKTATRYIDRLSFNGSRASTTQELQFPRGDDTTAPTDIQYASCEIAYALLDGIEPELEYENLSMTAQTYGKIKSTYNVAGKAAHIVAGIPSIVAWRYLLPYLADPRAIDVYRV